MTDDRRLKRLVLDLLKIAREQGPERGPGGLEMTTITSGRGEPTTVIFRFRPED
jgi:hypothetical protein